MPPHNGKNGRIAEFEAFLKTRPPNIATKEEVEQEIKKLQRQIKVLTLEERKIDETRRQLRDHARAEKSDKKALRVNVAANEIVIYRCWMRLCGSLPRDG